MGGEGWRHKDAAELYRKRVEVVSPGRREVLQLIASTAALFASEKPHIMDIGCGWGEVSGAILERLPRARLLMTDYAPEMLQICRERFANTPNIVLREQDLNEGLGEFAEGVYDAVVSCFALHHVDYEVRVRLYTEIRRALRPGGVFVNGDLFICSSPALNQWEFDGYVSWMREQLKEQLNEEYTFEELKAMQLQNYRDMEDKPGTVWDMKRDLEDAGFTFVDCLYKYQNVAVITACAV